MMHREVAAIVLCIFAQAASAQCAPASVQATNNVDANTTTTATTPTTTASARPAPAAQPNNRAELIKTAAAGTRDDLPPTVRESTRAHPAQQDHPRRGGTAMLLAALALMSGIALRRYAARNP
jgi:hypothetical protein